MTTRYLSNITLGLLVLTLTSASLLISSNSSADDSGVDNVSITIPVTCTMVGTGMNSHTATIENGTYRGDDVNGIGIGETTLKAYCNDTSGFSIYVIGYTNEEYGNTVLKSTTLGDTYNIITGTNTGPVGTEDISNWSMKLKAVSGTYTPTIENGYSNYSNVPTTYTKVATKASGTDMGSNAEGSSIKSTYAAYISKTQPSDTYEGKVKYTLVHPASEEPLQPQPATAGCINYFANASTAVGEMGCQTATNNASVDLWASNFSRTGYGFAGWNDKFDYSGNYYGPNETITAPADVETNGLSLYAVWIKSAGTIQNWNGCNSLTSGATTALTDERDNNTYAVAKLADNKCWMIENLRLENTGAHNTDGSLAQGYNSSFIGLADPESADFTNSTTANSLYSTDGSTAAPAITGSYTGYRFPRYNNNNTSSRQSSSGYSVSGNTYSMGNYYTWPAAIADTTYYSTNNQSIENTSLCPAGWHLPKGGNNQNTANNEYLALGVALTGAQPADYDSTTYPSYTGDPEGTNAFNLFRSYPNNFLYSGDFFGSSAGNKGSYGLYWSSTARTSSYSYSLTLYSSYVGPGTYAGNKGSGYAIRCTLGS